MSLRDAFHPVETIAQKRKVGRVMREFRRGSLKSGGKRRVKNRKQAIAIALSEARRLRS